MKFAPVKRLVSLAALIFGLSSCANFYWANPANPNANFEQDLDGCVRYVTENPSGSSTAIQPISGNPDIPEAYVSPVNTACAGNSGIFGCNNAVADAALPLDICLMSKGWRMNRQ